MWLDVAFCEGMKYITDNGEAVEHTLGTALIHELVHALTGRLDDGAWTENDPDWGPSVDVKVLSLDSIIVRVHPDGTGALKKTAPQAIGKSRGGWTTKVHLVAANAETVVTFCLSTGNDHDAPMVRFI